MIRDHRSRTVFAHLALTLIIGFAGCSDPQVGSIKAQDGPKVDAGNPEQGGRFQNSTPAQKAGGKPIEEGIHSR